LTWHAKARLDRSIDAMSLAQTLYGLAFLVHAGTPLAAYQAVPEPPSSLEPEGSRKSVQVSHRHRRVVSCANERAAGKARCVPKLAEADSATSLRLEKLPRRASSVNGDVVALTFPSQHGRQQRELSLAFGRWQVRWGESQSPAFSVDEQAAPAIVLETRSGSCEGSTDGCRLNTADVAKTIRVLNQAKADAGAEL
jgi:hypothetical protein